MIGAVIHNQKNTLVIDFPRGMNDLQLKLMSIGINRMPQEIPITNYEKDDIRVELYSESEIGNHLIRLFQPTGEREGFTLKHGYSREKDKQLS